ENKAFGLWRRRRVRGWVQRHVGDRFGPEGFGGEYSAFAREGRLDPGAVGEESAAAPGLFEPGGTRGEAGVRGGALEDSAGAEDFGGTFGAGLSAEAGEVRRVIQR